MNFRISGMKSFFIAGAVFLLIINCAYYNTFYFAQKYFREAEESRKEQQDGTIGQGNKQLYEKAIKKASKILAYYPTSKWVDDALMLIGKALYRQEEYRKASRKFVELITNFPRSNYVDDANYWLGLTEMATEDYIGAEESFRKVIGLKGRSEWADDAQYMLGEIYFVQERYPEAVAAYRRLVQEHRKSPHRGVAQFKIGEAFWAMEDFSKAALAFDLVIEMKPTRERAFESQFKLGESQLQLEQYEEALETFLRLTKEERFYDYLPQVKLKLGETLFRLNRREDAIRVYQTIPEEYPKTEESATAFYQLGLIYEREMGDLKMAKTFFDSSKGEKEGSEVAKKALERSASIGKLETYKTDLSGEETEGVAETQFHLAELYLLEMDQPDSAMAEYRTLVENFPESKYAPQAQYAIAWILDRVKGDSLAARAAYEEVIQKYPQTSGAVGARRWLGITPAEVDTDYAELLFLEAERLFFDEGGEDSALAVYRRVVAEHPESEYAPKAQYVLAWTYENRMDSLASVAYQQLVDQYSGTEYAQAARRKLGEKVEVPEKEEEPAPDTSQVTEVTPKEDGLSRSYPAAPEPERRGEFVYPDLAMSSGFEGTVPVKILIGPFGQVMDAELLTSTGDDLIDREVENAARMTKFDPEKLQEYVKEELGEGLDFGEVWFLYEIEVTLPR